MSRLAAQGFCCARRVGAGPRRPALELSMTGKLNDYGEESAIDPRTRRARREDMLVALRQSGGIYTVRGESGNTYRVDIATEECTCPDQQKTSTERCKHLRRVAMEIRNRRVPTPDGRLPERPVADGGAGAGTDLDPDLDDEDRRRVDGPLQEVDKHGRPTGAVYYRCTVCGAEAMRRQDLEDCCPVARR